MQRHYYVSEDLNELASVEQELEECGLETPHMHILSEQDASVEKQQLPDVDSLSKKNVVYSTEVGALIGLCAAGLILIVAHYSGLPEVMTWVPFIFLAIVVLGFCAWEGGLLGIQESNREFKRFAPELAEGKHVLMVDVDPQQESMLEKVMRYHPRLQLAGTGEAPSRLVLGANKSFRKFVRWAP